MKILAATDFAFGGLDARVHLVWAILALLGLAALAARKRREALRRFVPGASGDPAHRSVAKRRRLRTWILAAGLLALLFAALQPRSNPVKVKGKAEMRDLVVLLDVSRSMLAEDRKPNRLESVKLELARLADHLSGTRVGLVAFAGDAVVVCPLTANYSWFKRAIANVSTATAGQGGTRIGDAIRKAVTDLLGLSPVPGSSGGPQAGQSVMDEAREKREGRYADLLLFTDGEDHDSYPDYAAKQLRPLGIGLYAVGVGSPAGEAIPVEGGSLTYQGQVVKSALQDKALRELVVDAARGRYLPASVHHFDLVEFYDEAVRRDDGRETAVTRVEWQEVYQPFLLAGLALVLLAFAIPLRRLGPALVLLLAFSGRAFAEGGDPVERYNLGVTSLAAGKLDEAIPAFEDAAVRGPAPVRADALMNLGLCHGRKGEAIEAKKPEEEPRADAMKRLGAAAEAYRTALALFHRVPAPSPDADRGAMAAKARLLSVLDDLQKLADEERKEAEEKALSDPPGLLLRLLAAERDRRREVARLQTAPRRHRRLPARRIREAEYADRELLSKLAARVAETSPAGAEAAKKAAKAMEEAEGRLDAVDLPGVGEAQTRALADLTAAAVALPPPLPALVSALLAGQESLLALTKANDPALVPAEEGEMLPLIGLLSGEEDLRDLAGEASAAAKSAADLLDAGKRGESVPFQETVVAKLREIAEKLPKPPEPPVEKLKRLLATQEAARKAIDALPGTAPEARAKEAGALAEDQTGRGREAGAIAEELEKSPGEREKEAAPKVREAEKEIHGSSEALRRERSDAAGEAVDRDRKAIEEAIEILTGQKKEDSQEKPGNGQNPPKPEEGPKQDSRQLSPREARQMMEEMDRDRREEERKLLPGGGGPRVDKDW